MAYDWLAAQCDVIEVDFQKVDIHTGDKWLIYDIKRHRDNQFQRLNPPVEFASWLSRSDIRGSRWYHVESDILKEGPVTKTSWEVRYYRTQNA